MQWQHQHQQHPEVLLLPPLQAPGELQMGAGGQDPAALAAAHAVVTAAAAAGVAGGAGAGPPAPAPATTGAPSSTSRRNSPTGVARNCF
jgi:hypothetical protein